MYPARELSRLAAHKATLRRQIALNRVQCMEAAVTLARPFNWLDRALALWRKFLPMTRVAVLPLGVMLAGVVFPRMKAMRSLIRWGPLALGLLRSVGVIFQKARDRGP